MNTTADIPGPSAHRAGGRQLPRLAAFFALASVTGCSDAPAASTTSQLRINAQTTTEMSLAVEGIAVETEPESRIELTADLRIALGESYPSRLRATLPESLWDFGCGGLVPGRFELDEVLEVAPGLEASLAGGVLEISAERDGEYVFRAQGRFSPDQTPEFPGPCHERFERAAAVELVGRVEVVRPAHSAIELPFRCQGSAKPRIESGARLGKEGVADASVMITNAAGDLLPVGNAKGTTVGLDVYADASVSLTLSSQDAGLQGLVAKGPAGIVRLEPDVGEPLALSLVAARDVSIDGLTFAIPGNAGGFIVLEDEGVHDVTIPRKLDWIAVLVGQPRVEGEALCTSANPAAFTLESATPGVCRVDAPEDLVAFGPVLPEGDLVAAARIVGNGRCELRLRAAEYNAGSGIDETLRIDVTNFDPEHASY